MKENKRIIQLFEKLQDGTPWIDVNFEETLLDVSAHQAASRQLPQSNTIWEILHHVIEWRLLVLKRVKGKIIPSPAHNFFEPIVDVSEDAWIKIRSRLRSSQKKWICYLEDIQTKTFTNIHPNNEFNTYEHIQGILQHDAYHLGQIRLLLKYIEA